MFRPLCSHRRPAGSFNPFVLPQPPPRRYAVWWASLHSHSQGNIGLWNWLATVYDFTNPVTLTQSTRRDNYSCDATCTLYDGCGTALEAWGMGDAWPTAVNFGELDYATSEECTVEVTMRYANVSYANFCGPDVAPECEGCSGG